MSVKLTPAQRRLLDHLVAGTRPTSQAGVFETQAALVRRGLAQWAPTGNGSESLTFTITEAGKAAL